MILNLFGIMTGITLKWQVINTTPAVHPTKSRGNASKKIDYLPFLRLLSFETHGIAVGCKIAKRGGVTEATRSLRNQ
jgi:hypothetical protein